LVAPPPQHAPTSAPALAPATALSALCTAIFFGSAECSFISGGGARGWKRERGGEVAPRRAAASHAAPAPRGRRTVAPRVIELGLHDGLAQKRGGVERVGDEARHLARVRLARVRAVLLAHLGAARAQRRRVAREGRAHGAQ
jgi:hypothetical protein